jgi:hypothetical protein
MVPLRQFTPYFCDSVTDRRSSYTRFGPSTLKDFTPRLTAACKAPQIARPPQSVVKMRLLMPVHMPHDCID